MAVGICMSEILFSLIENTKINVPQFYSFAYQCVCSVVESSKTIKNFVSFEIGQILQELNKENKKRSYSGIIFKLIELLGKFTSIGNKKANKNIKIVKDIKELLNNHIKKKMSEQETINYQEYIESNLCMQKAENREDGMEG